MHTYFQKLLKFFYLKSRMNCQVLVSSFTADLQSVYKFCINNHGAYNFIVVSLLGSSQTKLRRDFIRPKSWPGCLIYILNQHSHKLWCAFLTWATIFNRNICVKISSPLKSNWPSYEYFLFVLWTFSIRIFSHNSSFQSCCIA